MIIALKTNNFKLQTDGFLIGTRFGVRTEIVDLENVDLPMDKVFLNIDKIIHESELAELEEFMKEHSEVAGFYYSDMSVFMLGKKLGLVDKLIYNPGTLVTSVKDAEFYLNLGIKRVCLSREITLEDILKFSHLGKKVEVLIHGKLNMFYSKRKLLTNYFDFLGEDVVKSGTLEEEIRDEHYPIIEDETGTHIFHEKSLTSFSEYNQLNQFTTRIDGLFLEDDELELAYKIYTKLDAKEDATELIAKYADTFGEYSGYYYKKTLYKK